MGTRTVILAGLEAKVGADNTHMGWIHLEGGVARMDCFAVSPDLNQAFGAVAKESNAESTV